MVIYRIIEILQIIRSTKMVGQRIRQIRKSKQLTLQDIAEKTGFSAGFLSQVERGTTDPSLSALRKISDALEVTPYMLL